MKRAFTLNAGVGISALALLENGTLTVTAGDIAISGLAASPQVDTAVTQTLQTAPDGVNISQNLTLLDDVPPRCMVR